MCKFRWTLSLTAATMLPPLKKTAVWGSKALSMPRMSYVANKRPQVVARDSWFNLDPVPIYATVSVKTVWHKNKLASQNSLSAVCKELYRTGLNRFAPSSF